MENSEMASILSVERGGKAPELVRAGDVWRKAGPGDWLKVIRVQMPHSPNYDGGLRGCSVVYSNHLGRWNSTSWFIPANNTEEFESCMRNSFRFKA